MNTNPCSWLAQHVLNEKESRRIYYSRVYIIRLLCSGFSDYNCLATSDVNSTSAIQCVMISGQYHSSNFVRKRHPNLIIHD